MSANHDQQQSARSPQEREAVEDRTQDGFDSGVRSSQIPEPKRELRPLFAGLNSTPLPKRATDPRVNRALVHSFRARHAEMQMTDTERRGYRALRCRVSCEAQP